MHPENYRPDIDGLRALAVVPVLLFHAKIGCPGGFVGVDIFFVISGFLITSLILKELNAGTFNLITFWERRIRRILPALGVVVLAALAAGWFFFLPEDYMTFGKSLIAQTTFLSNVFFYRQGLVGGGYFKPASDSKLLLHTWSLAVEEQFYIIFPLLLIFLARRPNVSLAKVIFALVSASLLLSVVSTGSYPQAAFFLLPGRAWELLIGSLVALLPGRVAGGVLAREMSGWAGVGLVFYAISFYDGDTQFPGLAAIPPCLGAALIIFSGKVNPSVVSRCLSFRPVVFIGLISYSLYLWHWPLLAFSKYWDTTGNGQGLGVRVSLLGLSIVFAILSWRYIEAPFRKRWIFQERLKLFGFAGCFIGLLLIVGIIIVNRRGFPSRLSGIALRYFERPVHQTFRNNIDLESALAGHFAEVGSENTNGPVRVLIWGDSHAMSIAPIIHSLCLQFSWRGIEATHLATAPVLGYISTDNSSLQNDSPAFADAVFTYITQKKVQNVIISARWASYAPSDRLFNAKLVSTVSAVLKSGARVYVLKDVPEQHGNLCRRIAVASLHGVDLKQWGITPGEHRMANSNLAKTFDRISQLGATVLDPALYFSNSAGVYGVIRRDEFLYFDDDHLTDEGALLLAPLFEPIFHNN